MSTIDRYFEILPAEGNHPANSHHTLSKPSWDFYSLFYQLSDLGVSRTDKHFPGIFQQSSGGLYLQGGLYHLRSHVSQPHRLSLFCPKPDRLVPSLGTTQRT